MSIVTTPVDGTPCWVDLTVASTTDQAALGSFLTDLYGWTWDTGDERTGYYAVARSLGAPVFGLAVGPSASTTPVTYFATSDAESSARRAGSLGASIELGPVRVMDLGWTTVLVDPTGAPHGLWQPLEFAGFGRMREVNAPGWFDHVSSDSEAAVRYYTGLTGHDVLEPEPGMRILRHDGEWFASITQPQVAEDRPRWNPVYVVDELAGTLDVVRRHGGEVLVETMPVPGSAISVFRDPVVGSVMTVMAAGTPG